MHALDMSPAVFNDSGYRILDALNVAVLCLDQERRIAALEYELFADVQEQQVAKPQKYTDFVQEYREAQKEKPSK